MDMAAWTTYPSRAAHDRCTLLRCQACGWKRAWTALARVNGLAAQHRADVHARVRCHGAVRCSHLGLCILRGQSTGAPSQSVATVLPLPDWASCDHHLVIHCDLLVILPLTP